MIFPAMKVFLFLQAILLAALFLSLHSHPALAENGSVMQQKEDHAVASSSLIKTAQNAISNSTNLVENGSFEDGIFNLPPGGNVEILNAFSVPNAISGWVLVNGSLDRARGRWKRASDCTPTCLDLTGSDSGTITTSFRAASPNSPHSILLDATANPDATSPINGTFTVAVRTSQNVTLNSSLIYVDGNGYNEEIIGWHTYAVFFTSPPIVDDNLTLSLSSNIIGWYGPLTDNIRIYEGLYFPNSDQDATCVADLPEEGKSKTPLVLATVLPSCFIIILAVGVYIWWRGKQGERREVQKAISLLQGRLKIFHYKVLKNSTENFRPDHKLGEGTFGAVYKGILEDGSEVAIKQLFSTSPQGQEEFLNEAMVISSVQHRNLVSLKGCCVKGPERFLVCDYVENKSLYQVLWGSDAIHLDWPMRFQIILGTARGLAYLHEASQPRIIHRDIKASNILLDKNFEAKIADFGLARWFPDDKTHVSTHIAGTLGYLAPEYAMRGQLSEKADVFSFGIVVLELVTGRKNLDYKLSMDEQYLLDWAKQLCSKGRMRDLIDLKLRADDDRAKEEITRVIRVGLWCTQEVAAMRPTMSEAMSMLQRISEPNDKSYNAMDMIDVLDSEAGRLLFPVKDSSCSFSISSSHVDNIPSSCFSSLDQKQS